MNLVTVILLVFCHVTYVPLLNISYFNQGESLGDDELQAMIDEFDSTGTGEIDEKDFLKIMKQTSIY